MSAQADKWIAMMPVFSTDPERRAIELAFFTRLSTMLDLLNQDPHRFMELATEGKLQALLPDVADDNVPPVRQAFESLEPFDYDAWAKQKP